MNTTTTQAATAVAAPDPAASAATPAWPRLLAVCVLLTGLVFVQDAGRVATDTKLDLTVDPWGFLARTLHLWEPAGFFGQLQNQAYGYLVPIGPFFGIGDSLGFPDWVVQRLWWALILSGAFLGVERLAAALGIGTPWTRILAGVAYALSPRMLTVIGPTSIEVLPMALAPWVVLPLVHGSRHGSPRRAAALSGLVVFASGGVNAVATAVALIPAALFLLTRGRGPRRWRLFGWWAGAVVLATAWWVVPLLQLGRFSPPFLDWIENATVTTAVTSIATSLRGTSQWVAYLTTPAGPELRAGWQLLTVPAVVLHTGLLVAIGLTGLALARLPERRWLVLGVLSGLVLVTLGHVGDIDGGLAGPAREALDGVLAPLRNTHKFDVVLRLPLCLAIAHALAEAAGFARRRTVSGEPVLPTAVRLSAVGMLALVVAGAAAPVLTNRLTPSGSYEAIPGYWRETAAWLDQHADEGTALVVPGSQFGNYLWGRTRDEPLQPLTDAAWAVRDAVPLTPAGTIRAMDAIQRRLQSGVGSAGLAPTLARMGVAHLVVRNDLDTVATASPRPVLVRAALADSPGLRPVTSFGPLVGEGHADDVMVDDGLDVQLPAVEVWSVAGTRPRAELVPASQVLEVTGGAESLLDLGDRGLAPSRPVILTGDLDGTGDRDRIVTDGMRRREDNFGAIDRSTSFTLTPSDPRRLSGAARDYLPFDGFETAARWIGVDDVVVSSSAGDADAVSAVAPGHQPFAALDGDQRTSWQSSGNDGAVGQWFEIRLTRAFDPTGAALRVIVDEFGTQPSRVAVTTDAGTFEQRVRPGVPTLLLVPDQPTRRLRVTLVDTATSGAGHGFAISELTVPALVVSRTMDVPAGGSSAYLTTADGATRECVPSDSAWLCSWRMGFDGEDMVLDRVVSLASGRRYGLAVVVVPRPGPELSSLLDAGWEGASVTATSSAVSDPAGRPQLVLDQDLGTGWVAQDLDLHPALTIRLAEPRRITGVRVTVDQRLAASIPASVEVTSPAGQREGKLAADGAVSFEPLRTDEVTLTFPTLRTRHTYDRVRRVWRQLPVGASEVQLAGVGDLLLAPMPWRTIRVPCGDGPSIQVGSEVVELTLTTTAAAVVAGEPVAASSCSPEAPDITGGLVRVRMPATDAWTPRQVDLATSDDLGEPVASLPAAVVTWGETERVVALEERATETLLVVRENTSDGWHASLGGTELPSVTVDGWQQGWRVPAGEAGQVQLVFVPDRAYRWSLAGGVVAVLILVGLAAATGRRSWPAVGSGRSPRWLVAGGFTLLMWLIGGWWAVAAVAVGAAGIGLLPARLQATAAACAAGAASAATAVLLAFGPWGSADFAGNDRAPQLTSLLALGVVVGALIIRTPRRGSHRNA